MCHKFCLVFWSFFSSLFPTICDSSVVIIWKNIPNYDYFHYLYSSLKWWLGKFIRFTQKYEKIHFYYAHFYNSCASKTVMSYIFFPYITNTSKYVLNSYVGHKSVLTLGLLPRGVSFTISQALSSETSQILEPRAPILHMGLWGGKIIQWPVSSPWNPIS